MSDQNPSQSPGGSGDAEQIGPTTPGGSGSIYESSGYQQEPPVEPTHPAGAPPPGYQAGYPPPGAYAAPPAKNNTQLYGVLSIVLAVVCCPLLGILFGWLSMNEAKKTGSDATLGKVGFWLGIAITAIAVVSGIIAICAGGMTGWNNWD